MSTHRDVLVELGRALRAAGFDEQAITEAVGQAPNPEAVSVHVGRLPPDNPVTPLIRLFVLGERVPARTLSLSLDELAGGDLVERDREWVWAPLRITPFAGLLIAHDGDDRGRDPDYVGGISGSARTLATLTVRRPVARALDVGTGCGVQALLAAKHAVSVVATDVNPRALEYAGLNARLNGVALDLREGSLFEPLNGETFDLIVANPPFVVSPDRDFLIRDSGMPGDEFTREVVRGAGRLLCEGGFATILCNWICHAPDEGWQPLVPWVEGSGCDALLLAHQPIDRFRYAASWNEPFRHNPPEFAAAVERWLDYYEHEGVAALGIGAVILRRREGANWIRGFDLRRPSTGAAGQQILRLFAAADHLTHLEDDAALLEERFRAVPGHRLDQSLVYRDEYEISGVTMSLEQGVGLVGAVDPVALPALFALRSDSPLGDVLAQTDVDAADALPTFRRLYEQGLLERG